MENTQSTTAAQQEALNFIAIATFRASLAFASYDQIEAAVAAGLKNSIGCQRPETQPAPMTLEDGSYYDC